LCKDVACVDIRGVEFGRRIIYDDCGSGDGGGGELLVTYDTDMLVEEIDQRLINGLKSD
jgi:hypothetical protein